MRKFIKKLRFIMYLVFGAAYIAFLIAVFVIGSLWRRIRGT